jgi:hypothetical protein
VDVKAGVLGQADRRAGAHARDDGVGADAFPVREHHDVLGDLGDPLPQPQIDAVGAVQPGEVLAQLRPEHPEQRRGLRFDDGHRGAVGARRRGGLQADPACAHDHHAPAAFDRGAQPFGVGERTQIVRGLAAGDGQVARHAAGGQQQFVVGDAGTLGCDDHAPGAFDVDGDGVEPEVDVVVGVPLRLVDEELFALLARLQEALGQLRPLVGALGLRAEHHDLSVEPVVSQ